MRERGDGLRLALEAREGGGVGREPVGKNFDRDVAVELRVARAVDLPHSARSERPDHLVGSELRSGGERHINPFAT